MTKYKLNATKMSRNKTKSLQQTNAKRKTETAKTNNTHINDKVIMNSLDSVKNQRDSGVSDRQAYFVSFSSA